MKTFRWIIQRRRIRRSLSRIESYSLNSKTGFTSFVKLRNAEIVAAIRDGAMF